jgi:hypothetical protein
MWQFPSCFSVDVLKVGKYSNSGLRKFYLDTKLSKISIRTSLQDNNCFSLSFEKGVQHNLLGGFCQLIKPCRCFLVYLISP